VTSIGIRQPLNQKCRSSEIDLAEPAFLSTLAGSRSMQDGLGDVTTVF